MDKYDVLFIHAPNLSNFYLPSGRFINNNYIPMGTIALANLVKEANYKTAMLHLGVEKLLDKDFSIVEFVKKHEIKFVGMDLFWFHQSYDVIDVAKKIKNACPNIFIYLGGLTASYYAQEILKNFNFIDAVTCGYGESNTLQLVKYVLEGNEDIKNISNLYYRDANQIVSNKLGVVCPDVIDNLNYSSLEVLVHYQQYVDYFGLHEMPLNISECRSKIMNSSINTKMFPLAVGRGCDTACLYCGGHKGTCKKLNGSNYLVWRNIDAVINDIIKVKQYGYNKVFICFDPVDDNDSYYIRLFNRIKEQKIDISMYFECWKLPSEEFIMAFSETFPDDNSHLLLSIDTVSEKIRKSTRGSIFSNDQLKSVLTALDNNRVKYDLCFSLALPGSTYKEDFKTYEYMKSALQSFKMIGRVITFFIDLVPGSLIYEHPERYDAEVNMHSFMDFYHAFENPMHSTYALCEYKLKHYFEDERDLGSIADFAKHLQYVKCKYFCGINEQYKQQKDFDENAINCACERQRIYDEMGVDLKAIPFNDEYNYNDELSLFMEKYKAVREEYI